MVADIMLGAVIVIITGFLAGHLVERLGIPRLLGMLIVGVLIGPHALGWISGDLLSLSNEIRMLALTVILLKAGLGLDKKKILAQGNTAILLGIIPCTMEAAVLAISTHYLLGWDWTISWLLGWIVCAESPAVLVPMMLRLKSEGWGAKSGLPDLVLAGGALSDVVAITVFGIVLDTATMGSTPGLATLGAIPLSVAGGLVAGLVAGKLLTRVLYDVGITRNATQDLLIALTAAVALVMGGDKVGYSGYLAAMMMGFTIVESSEVLARRIRAELDRVWVIAEIFLFVLIGAEVNVSVVRQAGGSGIALLVLGLLLGRMPGVWISTARSTLSSREKLFMSVGYLAKATVQAAIGAIPLSMGIPHGEVILAFAVLAIIVTAPVGAIGTSLLAPRLLQRGDVDPTKVTVEKKYRFLVALDQEGTAMRALEEAAQLARQLDATLMILHVDESGGAAPFVSMLYDSNRYLISDVEHDLVIGSGNPVEGIIQLAISGDVDMIFMGKGTPSTLASDITPKVLEQSPVPVIVVS
ncbi:MAG: universal stress protein [Firmicutes bacterium]|nr:universal stress protein [Bacillota bacterium]